MSHELVTFDDARRVTKGLSVVVPALTAVWLLGYVVDLVFGLGMRAESVGAVLEIRRFLLGLIVGIVGFTALRLLWLIGSMFDEENQP